MELKDYATRFDTVDVSRTPDGVLTLRLHTGGGSHVMSRESHKELGDAFMCVGSDIDTRVVVLTGTGDCFVAVTDDSGYGLAHGLAPATFWNELIWEGNRMLGQLLDIPVPVISAVNGPVWVHSELAVLSDIVLATPEAWFSDEAHFAKGLVPGDGMQVLWPLLLGPNRGRAFLLSGERLTAEEAHRLGVVWEVVPGADLMGRAYELARRLASMNPVVLRGTRSVLTRPLKRAVADDLPVGLGLEAVGSLSGAQFFAAGDPDAS